MTSLLSELRYKLCSFVAGTLLVVLPATSTIADDIDVFTAGLNSSAKPNILFVLDFSGSMGGTVDSLVKADILKNAVESVLVANADKLNVGVSMFSRFSTGVKWPVSGLDAFANSIDPTIPTSNSLRSSDVLTSIINNYPVGGGTNTVGGLLEAALYFQGSSVTNGGIESTNERQFEPQTWNDAASAYTGGSKFAPNPYSYTPIDAFKYNTGAGQKSYCKNFYGYGGPNYCEDVTVNNCVVVPESTTTNSEGSTVTVGEHELCEYTYPHQWNGANYNSPITDECQSNFIVLVSDGQPTVRNLSEELTDVLNDSADNCADLSNSIFQQDAGTKTHGNCGPEIVNELYNNDQIDSIDNSTVQTYTIGFDVEGPGKEYLKLLAAEGGGQFFSASQPEDLSAALESILSEILGSNENFAQLAIDVNKATFSHDNRVFFPLFKPGFSRTWQGNLKGYFIDRDGLKDINNTLATATDSTGTHFSDTAQSFWSSTADGNEVEIGGANSKLGTNRTIYTFTAGTPSESSLKRFDGANLIDINNGSLSADMVGVPGDDAAKDVLIQWLHDASIGDALHSRPTSVKYASRNVTYLMTNQGLIHAFDTTNPTDPTAGDSSGGQEIFAFMPPELLTNLPDLADGSGAGGHIYGLDGGITRWHDDTNNDGIVNNSESAMLIFGMRRGGNNYYALDISDPENPVYKWKITGGAGDFANLAQSWSRMSLITVKKGTGSQQLLAFGGGYDAATLDGKTGRTQSSGNAVYFIDMDGKEVWTATHSAMDYSIPSDLTPIDSDADGYADRIYVGDTGGQIWRLDFPDMNGTKTVTPLADLGDDSFQPFFYPPSIALNNKTSQPFLSIAIGSGNRTDPLTFNTQNRLFMIRDTDIGIGAPTTTGTIKTGNLYDATANNIGSSNSTVASAARDGLAAASGWYVNLSVGEKALSRVVTFEGRLLATTFSPIGSTENFDVCGVTPTTGRYYAMDILDATPVEPLGDNSVPPPTELNATHRHIVISAVGIPSAPLIVFPKGSGSVQIVVDKQTVDLVNQRLDRMMWQSVK